MGRKAATDPRERMVEVGGDYDRMVSNILGWYYRASDAEIVEGQAWYGVAGDLADELAVAGGFSREHGAAIISHLSPQTDWDRNMSGAREFVATGGETAFGIMGASIARANVAMRSDAPLATFGDGGPKTRRFAHNILGDRDGVTVDIWAARAAFGDMFAVKADTVLGWANIYAITEGAYKEVAAQVGETPADLQAIVWVTIRNADDAAKQAAREAKEAAKAARRRVKVTA
ncbi:hypothetical protein [Micromonospora sp. GCM10011541]|uniref:DUF7178 family protein n=1 Tax=Micromonospora sp. GCM10011541 TaxID=3317336 RepID=UPI003611532C